MLESPKTGYFLHLIFFCLKFIAEAKLKVVGVWRGVGGNYQPSKVLKADIELMPSAHLSAFGDVNVI